MKSLFEVFYQPGKLFESLPERRGAWVVPMIAGIIVMVIITALTVNLIGMREIMRQRLATSNLSPEQLQAAMANADKPVQVYVSYAAAAIATPLTLLVVAGVLTAFGMMTSRTPKFGSMLAMVCLSFFPYWLVTGAMAAAIILATPDRSSLDVNNIVATNIAAYVDRNTVSKGLYSLLGSLDALSFSLIWLLAYGFAKLTKASVFFGLMAIGLLWAFYVIMKMGASLLF